MRVTKIGRLARLAAYYGFTRHLPDSRVPGSAICKTLRYWNCRGLFDSCGVEVNIERGAYFGCGNGISIGDHSGIGIDAWISCGTKVGSHVMMGPGVMIFSRNHKSLRTDIPMAEQGATDIAPVVIEDDVWIGARAILLPGLRIGSGSIVGAGAVVSKDVPPNSVVAGNPARIIRSRNRTSEP